MRNIWHSSKKRFGYFELLLTSIIFIALLVWINIGFNSVRISSSAKQLNETQASIEKAVVLCYSIEGAFPPSIDYLKENYGLFVDEKNYIINYNVFASNIMPDITVLMRN